MTTNIIELNDHQAPDSLDPPIYYGNLKPKMWKDGKPRIFIGPQRLITLLEFLTDCTFWQRMLGMCIHYCFLSNLLEIGLSSPGLAAQYRHESNLPANTFCDRCQVRMVRGTRHCMTCDVCVAEYDHHCIFLGKCIGKDNMGEFKAVLCCVFVNLIYFGVINFINNPHF